MLYSKEVNLDENGNPILYKVEDIEKIFGCEKKKAYRIMHSKNFPSMKIGGILYVEQKALNDWIFRSKGKVIS